MPLRTILVRSTTIVLLLAVAMAGATWQDSAGRAAWPLWLRFLVGMGVLLAIMGAIVVLQSLLAAKADAPEPVFGLQSRGPRYRTGVLLGTTVFLCFVLAAELVERWTAISSDRIVLTGMAAGIGWCTLRKPWWFWDHWKAGFLRELVGDQATTAIYLLIAGYVFYIAWFGNVSALFH